MVVMIMAIFAIYVAGYNWYIIKCDSCGCRKRITVSEGNYDNFMMCQCERCKEIYPVKNVS